VSPTDTVENAIRGDAACVALVDGRAQQRDHCLAPLFACEGPANQLRALWLAVRLDRPGGNAGFELRREGELRFHVEKSTAD
jgi:hypothetical protein